jgi:hypothetical protein
VNGQGQATLARLQVSDAAGNPPPDDALLSVTARIED